MKNTLLFLSISIASGLLFVNLYTSLVDAKSWGSDLPNSIDAARTYFKVVNPGNFFRIFSPLNQVLGVLVVMLFWKAYPSVRIYLSVAVLMYILCDVITFAYFYPRNDIMFKDAALTDVELLKRTWAEWSAMNWVRSAMLVIGLFFSFLSVHKVYIHWVPVKS